MKIVVTADEVFHKSINLTEGKIYEVITYFEHQGDKLVLIVDDTYETSTYNIAHFKKINFEN